MNNESNLTAAYNLTIDKSKSRRLYRKSELCIIIT